MQLLEIVAPVMMPCSVEFPCLSLKAPCLVSTSIVWPGYKKATLSRYFTLPPDPVGRSFASYPAHPSASAAPSG